MLHGSWCHWKCCRVLWDYLVPGLVEGDIHCFLFVLSFSFLRLCKILNLQIIEANLNGELNLKIETELVCVTTHFKDLGNPPLGKFSGGLCFAFDKLFQLTHLTEVSNEKRFKFR